MSRWNYPASSKKNSDETTDKCLLPIDISPYKARRWLS
jgi:hypothetical protein